MRILTIDDFDVGKYINHDDYSHLRQKASTYNCFDKVVLYLYIYDQRFMMG